MRIHKLSVQGFKSMRDSTWMGGQLNVLIGPNGSGKSNLLSSLQLLSALSRGELKKNMNAMGGVETILWDGKANAINVTCEVEKISDNSNVLMSEIFEMEVSKYGRRNEYYISRECFSGKWYLIDKKKERLEYYLRNEESPEPKRKWMLPLDSSQLPMAQEDWLNIKSESFNYLREYPKNLEEAVFSQLKPISSYEDYDVFTPYFLRRMIVYKQLRTDQNAEIRLPQVVSNPILIDSDGENIVAVLHNLYTTDGQFKSELEKALSAAFPGKFEELRFPPAGLQRVQLAIKWKNLNRLCYAPDLSDGTLRFIFLIAILTQPLSNTLIAIEEPEVGLHPSMLSVFAEYAAAVSQRNQIVITTHSPDVVEALGGHNPTITVSELVDGNTIFKNIENNELQNWMEKYSLSSLFRSGELEDLANEPAN